MPVVVLANLTVAVASVLQRSTGLGFSLVAVPLLVLLVPGSVPASLLLLMLPMNLVMIARETERDGFALRWLLGGRLLGTVAAFGILLIVSTELLNLLIGLTVLGLVAAAVSPRLRVTVASCVGVGVVSGVAGTVAASGGTPVALLLTRYRGARLRGSIAPVLALGTVMSLGALAVAGELRWSDVQMAVVLAPGMVVGLVGGERLAPFLDSSGAVRPLLLVMGAIGGIAVVVRSLPALTG